MTVNNSRIPNPYIGRPLPQTPTTKQTPEVGTTSNGSKVTKFGGRYPNFVKNIANYKPPSPPASPSERNFTATKLPSSTPPQKPLPQLPTEDDDDDVENWVTPQIEDMNIITEDTVVSSTPPKKPLPQMPTLDFTEINTNDDKETVSSPSAQEPNISTLDQEAWEGASKHIEERKQQLEKAKMQDSPGVAKKEMETTQPRHSVIDRIRSATINILNLAFNRSDKETELNRSNRSQSAPAIMQKASTSDMIAISYLRSRVGKELDNALNNLIKNPTDENALKEFIKQHQKLMERTDITQTTKAAVNTYLAMTKIPLVANNIVRKSIAEEEKQKIAEDLFLNLPEACINKETQNILVKLVGNRFHLKYPAACVKNYEEAEQKGQNVGIDHGVFVPQGAKDRRSVLAQQIYNIARKSAPPSNNEIIMGLKNKFKGEDGDRLVAAFKDALNNSAVDKENLMNLVAWLMDISPKEGNAINRHIFAITQKDNRGGIVIHDEIINNIGKYSSEIVLFIQRRYNAANTQK